MPGQAYIDSIKKSIIWQMNTLAIAATSIKFRSASEFWLPLPNIRSDQKIFEWIKLLCRYLDQTQETWAGRNFTATLHVNLMLIKAEMQR